MAGREFVCLRWVRNFGNVAVGMGHVRWEAIATATARVPRRWAYRLGGDSNEA